MTAGEERAARRHAAEGYDVAVVGARIRARRVALALTQQQLADAVMAASTTLGYTIDQRSISNWEKGTTRVSLRSRRALATALGMSVADLFAAK